MRAWRADVAHQAAERANRARWEYARKLRETREDWGARAGPCPSALCGFCRRLPPVTQVRRLEVRDLAPRGYVEITVPYCGQC